MNANIEKLKSLLAEAHGHLLNVPGCYETDRLQNVYDIMLSWAEDFEIEALIAPDVEQIASRVHNAWWREKEAQGFHPPVECLVDEYESKFDARCDKCHADMYPYDELSYETQEYDRVTVVTVLAAIDEIDKG